MGGEIEELPIAVGVDELLLRSSSSASRRNATHIRRPAFAPVFIQISRVVAQHSPMIGELWHPLAPTLRNIFISCHYDYVGIRQYMLVLRSQGIVRTAGFTTR